VTCLSVSDPRCLFKVVGNQRVTQSKVEHRPKAFIFHADKVKQTRDAFRTAQHTHAYSWHIKLFIQLLLLIHYQLLQTVTHTCTWLRTEHTWWEVCCRLSSIVPSCQDRWRSRCRCRAAWGIQHTAAPCLSYQRQCDRARHTPSTPPRRTSHQLHPDLPTMLHTAKRQPFLPWYTVSQSEIFKCSWLKSDVPCSVITGHVCIVSSHLAGGQH